MAVLVKARTDFVCRKSLAAARFAQAFAINRMSDSETTIERWYISELPELEAQYATHFGRHAIEPSLLRPNVGSLWSRLLADAKQNAVTYKKRYVFDLLSVLLKDTATDPLTYPSCDDQPWHDFVDYVTVEAPNHLDGILLGAVYWDGRFGAAPLSFAWLFMNGIRVQNSLAPLKLSIPPDRLLKSLTDSRDYSSEILRAELAALCPDGEVFDIPR